ncbi:MAG: chromatin protein Cren7 [Sulfolobaceae archaeon]
MPKRKSSEDIYVCPSCGNKVKEPVKTWQLISPLPDSQGRITITVMGSFVCNNCGNRWKGVVSKIKAGGSSIEIEGKKGVKKIEGKEEEQEKERGEVIELDISDLDEEE